MKKNDSLPLNQKEITLSLRDILVGAWERFFFLSPQLDLLSIIDNHAPLVERA
jgi:hypothetical protein